MKEEKFAIRFGLGAVKAVGFSMMENAVKERNENGLFKDIYDFAARVDAKSINKKSVEALAKAGAFDCLNENRKQIANSFEILSAYSNQKNEESSSNQMMLFGGVEEAKPQLAKTDNWSKTEKLQKEFEAFGFFLNEHPIDDFLSDLRKRGVIFSDKLERDELEDGNIVKMAGVVAGSKHRSSARGRFAYLTISDPFGIFEAMIFDEAIITNARDILTDGSLIFLECLVRKDDGGLRILVKEVKKLNEFITQTKAADKDFEDIKKQIMRQRKWEGKQNDATKNSQNYERKDVNQKEENLQNLNAKTKKEVILQTEISLKNRDDILKLKAFLSNYPALENSDKQISSTKILVKIGQSTIELADKYSLSAEENKKLQQLFG